ncbi:MAG: DUF87 domain-containing protein [Actinomycetota bacterium]
MAELVALLSSAVFLGASLLLVRWMEQKRLRADMVAYRVQYPEGLDVAAVIAFLSGLGGLLRPWRVRLFVRPVVTFEVTAKSAAITHHLIVPRSLADQVLGQLRAAVPGAVAWLDAEHRPARPDLAGELVLSSLLQPLKTDQPSAASAAILASLVPLQAGESVVMQWILTPAPPTGPSSSTTSTKPSNLFLKAVSPVRPPVTAREAREKAAGSRFWAVGRIGAVASPARAHSLLRQLTGSFHSTSAPGVHFRRRRLPSAEFARRMVAGAVPLASWPCLLTAREAAIVVGFPLGSPNVAGLELIDRPPLPPSSLIPAEGRVIAQGNYPGKERPLAQDLEAVLRHTLVLGPTGTGKSYAAAGMILRDITAPDRRAVIVIDAKTDLVDLVLDRVPADRAEDVAVLDPTSDRPLGLDPLAHATSHPELVADQTFGILKRLWELKAAPRTLDLLHAALLTLAHTPGSVLPDLAPLLLDSGYRRRLVGPLMGDLALGPFWAGYQGMSETEWAQVVAPLMTRLRQFLLRPTLRAVIGQSRPRLTVTDVMAGGQVLLVPLAAGRLGQEAASLLGALLVADLWITTQARAVLPATARPPVSVFIDEWQTIIHLPTPLEEVLAQSRGYRVGYTLINQHLSQLPPGLREAVLANARSKVSFALPPADAAVMARSYGEPVRARDLERLRRYEVMLRLVAGSTLAPPTTGFTLSLPAATGHGSAIRDRSATRYGRHQDEVEVDLRARQTGPGPGPLGKRRRS